MARFFGKVGYAEEQTEVSPGVFEDNIVEIEYYGDVLRNTRKLSEGETLHKDLSVVNSISIVADAYANENFINIRYLEWVGVKWTVTNVEVLAPRLLLRLGEVYNGPTSAEAP